MTIIQEKGMIESHVDSFGRITRAEAAELCKCEINHAYYILKRMVDDEILQVIKQGKYTYYVRKEKT